MYKKYCRGRETKGIIGVLNIILCQANVICMPGYREKIERHSYNTAFPGP